MSCTFASSPFMSPRWTTTVSNKGPAARRFPLYNDWAWDPALMTKPPSYIVSGSSNTTTYHFERPISLLRASTSLSASGSDTLSLSRGQLPLILSDLTVAHTSSTIHHFAFKELWYARCTQGFRRKGDKRICTQQQLDVVFESRSQLARRRQQRQPNISHMGVTLTQSHRQSPTRDFLLVNTCVRILLIAHLSAPFPTIHIM